MCSAFSSGTSAHTYLSPFFLLFNDVINDQKLSETYSYLFLSLKCQQLSLAAPCPFLSPGSPTLRLLVYPTCTSGSSCSPHPRTAPASFFPSLPTLGQSLRFLSSPSCPVVGTERDHPGVCASAQLHQDGSFSTKLSPGACSAPDPQILHYRVAFLHGTVLDTSGCREGWRDRKGARSISLPLTNTHR